MATLDRIEPAYVPWTPSTSGLGVTEKDEDYVGRHRKPVSRSFSLTRLFYTARHRVR